MYEKHIAIRMIMLSIIVEQRFLRLPSVSCAKDRIRFLINFRALRAVFQRNKATLNYHLLRQYFIWHRLLRVFLTRSSEFSLPESMIAFELIGSVIIRCAPQKMITGHQVSSLDVCWNIIDAEKASMDH